jgi:hypothetical protein
MRFAGRAVLAAGCWLAAGAMGVGCGDPCDATVADMAGTYTLSYEGDDKGKVVITIDEEGNVTAQFFDDDGDADGELACEVVNDALCELAVKCKDDDGETVVDFQLEKSVE